MKFILAEKKEMTQKFGENGEVIPVTRVTAGPCVVIQIKNKDNDGYDAVQIGFGVKRSANKPLKGHAKDLGNFRYIKEFRVSPDVLEKVAVGNSISAETFQKGDKVKVTGTAKGRGFQGVVKRHGFHGSPATHGHKDQLRMPGSIGAGGVQHVFKGVRMGGHMGANQVTVANLEVVDVAGTDIFIKGAVPGPINNLILISGDGELLVSNEKQENKSKEKTEESTANKPVEENAEVSEIKKEEMSVEEPEEKVNKEEKEPAQEETK